MKTVSGGPTLPGRVAIVSYRLGGHDGVSIEAAKWAEAFSSMGAEVSTVAGAGQADRLVTGLAADSDEAVDEAALDAAIAGADLTVVENVCSLPLNPRPGQALARLLAGRPALLRHHDLPWQRPQHGDSVRPPDDPAWHHVTINERSRLELEARGIRAVTIYNCFDPEPAPGRREELRAALGVGPDERLVMQPTRAIRRKNVAGGILFARALSATYWLFGPAEDGYDAELAKIMERAGVRVIEGPPESQGAGFGIADAYAACDMVVLPSTFEGFGNPSVESATYRKPLAIGPYPVGGELRRFGFSWFDIADPAPAIRWLTSPDPALLDRNQYVARLRFSIGNLAERIGEVVTRR